MLKRVIIKNFIIIKYSEIIFDEGFNVITGETGAGKSIIISALKMLSGERAKINLIKNSEKEASIEAMFDLSKYAPHIIKGIENFGVDIDDDELIIKRVITSNKKNRIYINGSMFNLKILSQISSMLFNVSSQREYNLLLNRQSYIGIIDNYANLNNEVSEFTKKFNKLKSKKNELNNLIIQQKELSEKREFYFFMLKEINKIAPEKGELKKVEEELELLENGEEIKNIYYKILEGLNSERGVYYLLSDIIKEADKVEKFIPEEIISNLHEIYYSVENLAYDIQKLYDEVDIDFDKLRELSDRYHELVSLYKKYGGNEEMFFERYQEITEQIENTDEMEFEIKKVKSEINDLERELNQKAAELEEKRIKTAKEISDEITKILKNLDMKEAEMNIEVITQNSLNEKGRNKVNFLIKTNKNNPFSNLKDIASGGELSRVLLAIKKILTFTDPRLYIFDEIDQGTGGNTAHKIANLLKQISLNSQIIVITHLVQVASKADKHFSVNKEITRNDTISIIKSLDEKNRELELSRMIGDKNMTKAKEYIKSLLKTNSEEL